MFKLIDVELPFSVGLNSFINKVSMYTSCKICRSCCNNGGIILVHHMASSKDMLSNAREAFPFEGSPVFTHTQVASFVSVLPLYSLLSSLYIWSCSLTLERCNLSVFRLRFLLNNVRIVKLLYETIRRSMWGTNLSTRHFILRCIWAA